MKELKNFITPLHKSAKRDYLDRMVNEKAKCVKIAKNSISIIGMEAEGPDLVVINLTYIQIYLISPIKKILKKKI